MLMVLFYILLGVYFIARGGREAQFFPGSQIIEGFVMMGAGVFLVLAQLIH